jgi:Nucleotidyl transferase AbiEii toxin, Type IV TA system
MTAHRYRDPRAFKSALEDRLKRRALELEEDVSRLRQRSVFERFLARVVAHFGDRVVLKGGVALQLRIEDARTTFDIDLRMSGNPSLLLEELNNAGRLALDEDFMSFTIVPDPRHPTFEGDGVTYDGQRFRVQAALAGKIYGTRFGVDVGFGDHMAYPPEAVTGGELFLFAGIPPLSVRIYAREVHIAEKLHALTMPRARANSRVKDLPDLALLATTGPFESAALREAIQASFAQRRSHEVPSSIVAPPDDWVVPYADMAKENNLRWTTLDDLTAAVRAFLDPVLRGEGGTWDPASWSWRRSA